MSAKEMGTIQSKRKTGRISLGTTRMDFPSGKNSRNKVHLNVPCYKVQTMLYFSPSDALYIYVYKHFLGGLYVYKLYVYIHFKFIYKYINIFIYVYNTLCI